MCGTTKVTGKLHHWGFVTASHCSERSKSAGVYEFNFFNDKTLEKIAVCVDNRVPTKIEPRVLPTDSPGLPSIVKPSGNSGSNKKEILFCASSQGQMSSLEADGGRA